MTRSTTMRPGVGRYPWIRCHPGRMQPVHVWVRSESRGTERRAPVVPADVPLLLDAGLEVTVEESPQRVFAVEEYAAAGASVVAEGLSLIHI